MNPSSRLGFLYFTPLLFLENVGYTSNIFTYNEQAVPDWTGDIGLGLRASAIAANRLILQAEDIASLLILPGKQEPAFLEQSFSGSSLFLCRSAEL